MIDYNKELKDTLEKIKQLNKKPKLLLHACCGPCLTYPLSLLLDYFEITVSFYNPNIQPYSEYERRLFTAIKFIQQYAKDRDAEISFVLPKEDFSHYQEVMKGRENDKEGGINCLKCHAYRLFLNYHYAYTHHFDYFCSVMTVSSKKKSSEINEVAQKLEKMFPEVKYLYSDFKKENGQLKGILLAKKYNLYRQNYCGCLVSLNERLSIASMHSLAKEA